MIPDEQIDPASPVGQAQSFLKELTHLMGVDVTVAMGTDAENNIFAQMTGDTLGILIGRRGETLDALQYLTSLRINKGQDHYTRVTLDTENYRAKREDTLIRLANRMANRAVKTGRKVSLEPMNPYERRVIHSALQPNELVDTTPRAKSRSATSSSPCGSNSYGLSCKTGQSFFCPCTRKFSVTAQNRLQNRRFYAILFCACRNGGMADATDSKSVGSDVVWVQVPLPARHEESESDFPIGSGFGFFLAFPSGNTVIIRRSIC